MNICNYNRDCNEQGDKMMQDELCMVADTIKALRESRGLTQEQLAEKADISVSHLAKIESYMRSVGMKTYIKLLNAMDIPIKEHLTYMTMATKEMMLKEKIWYLVQDCDERETTLLICSIEGIKKGLKEYQEEGRNQKTMGGSRNVIKRNSRDSII
uniref:helix-turn-helix domain-containing protein n=2 Tax=Enterocloster clostridioformis TaxID=1531 RepID=UPI0025A64AB7|nr:helix-turn-helix transcriptional regulator [Enterocloster clostridioformis]